jgi:hypothetical protein
MPEAILPEERSMRLQYAAKIVEIQAEFGIEELPQEVQILTIEYSSKELERHLLKLKEARRAKDCIISIVAAKPTEDDVCAKKIEKEDAPAALLAFTIVVAVLVIWAIGVANSRRRRLETARIRATYQD